MDTGIFLKLGPGLTLIGLVLTPLFLVPLLTLVMPGAFGGFAKRLTRWINILTAPAGHFAIFSVLLLTAAEIAIILLRYAFGLSFTWLNEIALYAFAAIFMFGAAAALRDDAHVRVDILSPRFGEKGRCWVELCGCYLFLFPICVRLLSTGAEGLALSWRLLEGSRESDGLPILYLFKTMLPLFCVLMLAQGLAEACKAALRLTGQIPPRASTESVTHGT